MSNKEQYQHRLDARGLLCPMPLLKLRLALNTLAPGELLQVIADDEGSATDIPKYLKQSEHQLILSKQWEQEFIFIVQKGNKVG